MVLNTDAARGGGGTASSSSSSPASSTSSSPLLCDFGLYETRERMLLVGRTRDKARWRVARIAREETSNGALDAREDDVEYTEGQCAKLLRAIEDANATTGGCRLVARGCAVLGTIRFLNAHYLVVVTKRVALGRVCGHAVHKIAETKLVRLANATETARAYPLSTQGAQDAEERRRRRMLAWVDLSDGFFFSYTYPLTSTVQTNLCGDGGARRRRREGDANDEAGVKDFDGMFSWNAFISQPLRKALGDAAARKWLTPIVHGHFEQRRLSLLGRPVSVTLIARRSRHFAGTRYNRRGVDKRGDVANEVETEQIVDAGDDVLREGASEANCPYEAGSRSRSRSLRSLPSLSSATQLRGSIPLFWTQEASALTTRPEIVTRPNLDPLHDATAAHARKVRKRYGGGPVVMLSLVRSRERRPRESVLSRELDAALERVNSLDDAGERVACVRWDFKHHMRVAARRTTTRTTSASASGGGGGGDADGEEKENDDENDESESDLDAASNPTRRSSRRRRRRRPRRRSRSRPPSRSRPSSRVSRG